MANNILNQAMWQLFLCNSMWLGLYIVDDQLSLTYMGNHHGNVSDWLNLFLNIFCSKTAGTSDI